MQSLYYVLGDFRQAVALIRRNIASLQGDLRYEHFGLPILASVYSQNLLAQSLADLGEFAEGVAAAGEAIRIAEAADDPVSLMLACSGDGLLHTLKGEWARAVRSLERGHELVLTRDFPAHFVISGSRLGYAYALSGRVSEGLTLLEQSDARAEHLGRRIQQPLTLGWLSEAQLLAGRPEQALEAAHRALQLSDRRKQRGMGARAHWMLGEIAARRDPPDADEAESHYQDALALAEELGMRPLQARCHLGLGKLCRRIDRTDEARAELATAVAMLREMGMAFWLPEAERELAGASA